MGFTNSSLDIIRFYLNWLAGYSISKDNLIFRLTINNVFKNKEKQLKQFWLTKLGVKESQFSKTTIIKTSLKKADISKENTYKGTLRVKVGRGNALKNRILGTLEYISSCV
jgi:hypothetical protein